jgi:heptosyltransferase-2
VTLLAPPSSGAALLGGGPGDVQHLLSWDRADMATLLSADGVGPGRLRDELSGFDAAIAYTRSADLVRNLGAFAPRVLAHDPTAAPPGCHVSEWLAEPLAALGLAADAAPAACTASAEELETGRPLRAALGAGFLAVHPGSGSRDKSWPAERFASVIQATTPGRAWLLVEGPADTEAVGPLAEIRGLVRARQLPHRVLGALLAQAGIYIGNDSGVTHLAAAWGAPTLALFGPSDPAVWAPQGPHVRVLRSATAAMQDIPVEAVVESMRSMAILPDSPSP